MVYLAGMKRFGSLLSLFCLWTALGAPLPASARERASSYDVARTISDSVSREFEARWKVNVKFFDDSRVGIDSTFYFYKAIADGLAASRDLDAIGTELKARISRSFAVVTLVPGEGRQTPTGGGAKINIDGRLVPLDSQLDREMTCLFIDHIISTLKSQIKNKKLLA